MLSPNKNEVIWAEDYLGPHNLESDGKIKVSEPRSEIFEEDDLEDPEFEINLQDTYPGWYFVKMVGFTVSRFDEVEPWLDENVKHGDYQRVGWESGCSYSVGVVFESSRDALMFKLRWF